VVAKTNHEHTTCAGIDDDRLRRIASAVAGAFEARLLASAPDADHFHEGWRTCDARGPSISGQSTRRREQSAGVRWFCSISSSTRWTWSF
jgi:hypothetical protein